MGGTSPSTLIKLQPSTNIIYRNEGTNEVTIVPNTVDAYVSGILIDDDLTPAITTLDGMVEQPSAVFKTSQRDAEVVYLQELGC